MLSLQTEQSHIDWESPSIQETMKSMETTYPGGVLGYVNKAKQLLSHTTSAAAASTSVADAEQSTVQKAPKKRNLKNPSHSVNVDYTSLSSLPQLELGNTIAGNHTVFVIVAGGLGERLGAKSLKLALPVFTCDEDAYSINDDKDLSKTSSSFSKNNFITFYLSWMEHLRALANIRNHSNNNNVNTATFVKTPIFIMTSDDTHARTETLLKEFFHLRPQAQNLLEINLIKQTGVPCVCDSKGKLAVTEDGKHFILKPAGHGQVHRLILSSGLVPRYLENGFKYISFLQDTNAGAPTTIPYSLAVMEERNWTMSFTCIPRLPGEAIGALVEADDEKKKRRITYCVEYNVLDELLKEEGIEAGDSAVAASGEGISSSFSPFPGTINTLLLRLDQYNETLQRTQGAVAEFINPKYVDSKLKTTFKSPARLETLMQDIALDLLDNAGENLIGSCVFDRRTYFPVKNDLFDGMSKWKSQGIDPHNGSQGEAGIHLLRRLFWSNFVRPLGINNNNNSNEQQQLQQQWPIERCLPSFDQVASFSFADVTVYKTLALALFPIFISEDNDKEGLVGIARHFTEKTIGVSEGETKAPAAVEVSRKSALVLKTGSPDKNNRIILKSLKLDGSLVIDVSAAPAGTEVVVDFSDGDENDDTNPSGKCNCLTNKGWSVKALELSGHQQHQQGQKESHLLRGFRFDAENSETEIVSIGDAGEEGGRSYILKLSNQGKPVLVKAKTEINSRATNQQTSSL